MSNNVLALVLAIAVVLLVGAGLLVQDALERRALARQRVQDAPFHADRDAYQAQRMAAHQAEVDAARPVTSWEPEPIEPMTLALMSDDLITVVTPKGSVHAAARRDAEHFAAYGWTVVSA